METGSNDGNESCSTCYFIREESEEAARSGFRASNAVSRVLRCDDATPLRATDSNASPIPEIPHCHVFYMEKIKKKDCCKCAVPENFMSKKMTRHKDIERKSRTVELRKDHKEPSSRLK
jgi:hypothetical protein